MSRVPRRSFLAGCLVLALGRPADATPPPDAERIDRLIVQLGSKQFREREAAARDLKRLGKAALPGLRRAARSHDDAEVRRRARKLLEAMDRRSPAGEIAAITKARLNPQDKGRKLRALLHPGLDRARVYQWLGTPEWYICFDFSTVEHYPAYDLSIHYDRDGAVQSVTRRGED